MQTDWFFLNFNIPLQVGQKKNVERARTEQFEDNTDTGKANQCPIPIQLYL